MSSEQVNIIIGAGQLLFAVFLFFRIDSKSFLRKQTLSDITLEPKTMIRSKIMLILLVGGLAFSGYGFYRTFDHPRVTAENIESKVREWLDAFAIGTKKLPEPSAYFAFQVDLPSGIPLAIIRTKDHDRYLTLIGRISVVPMHRELFAKLSEPDKTRFIREVRLEAAKSRIAVSVEEGRFDILNITKRIPITDDLTEAALIEGVGEMNYAMLVVIDTIASHLEAVANK